MEVIKSISSKIESMPKDGRMPRNVGEQSHQLAGIVDSVLDKEKRRRNIVVHNLPEAGAQNLSERTAQDTLLLHSLSRMNSMPSSK